MRLAPSLSLFALASVGIFAAPHAALATPFYASLSDMAVTGGSQSYGGGAWTLNITVQNTSGSSSYNNVGLALLFVYPGNGDAQAIGPGLTYNTGTQIWSNGSQSLQYTSSSLPIGGMLMSDSDAPQTFTYDSYAASLAPTDTVPMVQLGNFSPGQSEPFTLVASEPLGAEFLFQSFDDFVAPTPEPGSLAILAVGALGMMLRNRKNAARALK